MCWKCEENKRKKRRQDVCAIDSYISNSEFNNFKGLKIGDFLADHDNQGHILKVAQILQLKDKAIRLLLRRYDNTIKEFDLEEIMESHYIVKVGQKLEDFIQE